MTEAFFLFEGAGWLFVMYLWLLSAILGSVLSRSKGYGEKPGLGTGLILHILGPVIWLFVPPKDELAEWHTRKPWQPRRKVTTSDLRQTEAASTTEAMAEVTTTTGTDAGEGGTATGTKS